MLMTNKIRRIYIGHKQNAASLVVAKTDFGTAGVRKDPQYQASIKEHFSQDANHATIRSLAKSPENNRRANRM